uniref:PH domain-containing protein n=1 Tax=Neogobius melanostomus TaxID=47308 RepID=A0A8C6T8R0_9GOBI
MKRENMDKQKVLTRLVWDLDSFLSLLDSENLSYIAQAQKKSLSELLTALHSTATTTTTTVEDAEYMVMSCPSTSPTEPTDAPPHPPPDVTWSVSKPDPTQPEISVSPEEGEDTYEEAAPYVAQPAGNTTEKAESDSSHYESYGDEDDNEEEAGFEGGARLVMDRRFVQWSASQPCLRPAPESRLCGYLWRRKWLGQWTKQLFTVRNHWLLCYKCSRDPVPQLELDLRGCLLVSKSKPQRRIPHTLRLVLPGSESLVLGFSDHQQALEWRTVMEELSSGDSEAHSASVIRTEPLSCRSSAVQTDSDDDRSSAPQRPHLDKGFLNVLMNCQWQSLRCAVEGGVLNMFAHRDPDQNPSPQYTVPLSGCQVSSGPDTAHSYRITLSTLTDQLAVLEVNSAEEKQRWIKLLQDSANQRQESAPPETTPPLSGLQTRRFPALNTYETQPLYSNSSVLQHTLHRPNDSSAESGVDSSFNSKRGAEARSVQRLELAGKTHGSNGVQLRAASERDLTSKHKRSSFRQSLAVCSERAQASFLTPLLRRTASAKLSLKRAPSVPSIESGRVSHRKREWETKASS